jgi:hypothetical protein
MAVNFPKNPPVGLTWLDPSNSVSYTWDGQKWSSTGTGVSFTTVIFSIDNDDPDIVGATTTLAINAVLIANGNISSSGDLRPGNTLLVIDSGNADANANVTVGQYLFDGIVWLRVPSTGAQVISIFGRIGTVAAQEGDYDIGQLGDVDLSSPTPTSTTNSLLRFDGTKYVPGEARNTPSVTLPLTKSGSNVTPVLGFSIDDLDVLPDV